MLNPTQIPVTVTKEFQQRYVPEDEVEQADLSARRNNPPPNDPPPMNDEQAKIIDQGIDV